MNLIDMHCDTLWKLMDLGGKGDFVHNNCDVCLSKLRKAESMAQFFACYVGMTQMPGNNTEEKYEAGYDHALKMIDVFHQQMRNNAEEIGQAGNYEEIVNLHNQNKLAAVLTVEEGGILNNQMSRVDKLYDEGVRLITLMWNHENCLGYPNSIDMKIMRKGLKPFGIQVVKYMKEKGMLVDVSHSSDGGFWDAMTYARGHVVASHSNCRALCPHPRNLSDDMIRALANAGGVSGVNLYGAFLDGSNTSDMDAMVAHIQHMIKVGGSDFPAIGTDFDGFDGMTRMDVKDIGEMGRLLEALERAGLSTGQIEKIWYGNVLRVLKETL